jgi:hypothetical protein
MMGGLTPDQVRGQGIDEAMAEVQAMGLSSDSEMYGALAKRLSVRGLTQDSLKAAQQSAVSRKDEETVRDLQSQRATREASQGTAERNADTQAAHVKVAQDTLANTIKNQRTLEEQIDAAKKEIPVNSEKVLGLQRELDAAKAKAQQEADKTAAEIKLKNAQGTAAVMTALNANASKNKVEKVTMSIGGMDMTVGFTQGENFYNVKGIQVANLAKMREDYDTLLNLPPPLSTGAPPPSKPPGGTAPNFWLKPSSSPFGHGS